MEVKNATSKLEVTSNPGRVVLRGGCLKQLHISQNDENHTICCWKIEKTQKLDVHMISIPTFCGKNMFTRVVTPIVVSKPRTSGLKNQIVFRMTRKHARSKETSLTVPNELWNWSAEAQPKSIKDRSLKPKVSFLLFPPAPGSSKCLTRCQSGGTRLSKLHALGTN